MRISEQPLTEGFSSWRLLSISFRSISARLPPVASVMFLSPFVYARTALRSCLVRRANSVSHRLRTGKQCSTARRTPDVALSHFSTRQNPGADDRSRNIQWTAVTWGAEKEPRGHAKIPVSPRGDGQDVVPSDELDRSMRVTGTKGWLALIALLALVAAAVVWGIFGTIPVVVGADEGVLLGGDSRSQAVSNPGGAPPDGGGAPERPLEHRGRLRAHDGPGLGSGAYGRAYRSERNIRGADGAGGAVPGAGHPPDCLEGVEDEFVRGVPEAPRSERPAGVDLAFRLLRHSLRSPRAASDPGIQHARLRVPPGRDGPTG